MRVPAVMVSPYIKAGTVIGSADNTFYDHSSIIATARKLFLPDWQNTSLTNRDKNAATFDHVLNLATPDNIPGAAPVALQEAHTAMMAARTAACRPAKPRLPARIRTLSNLQTDMVAHAHQAEQQYSAARAAHRTIAGRHSNREPGFNLSAGRRTAAERHLMKCTALLICALVCALASGAFGDDQFTKEVHTITNYCDDVWKDKLLDRTQDGQCAQAIVNGSPLHLNAQMFAPGSGLALGLGYKRLFTFGQAWQNNWDLGGMGSVEGAWEGHFVAHFDKQRPAPSITDTTPVLHRIVEKFEIQPYASAQQLTKLDYYGEGPQSSRSALALYTERDIRVGVGVSIPVAWWLNVGATVEGLWPSIGPASTSASPSVADFYRGDPTLAPGIASQPPSHITSSMYGRTYRVTTLTV